MTKRTLALALAGAVLVVALSACEERNLTPPAGEGTSGGAATMSTGSSERSAGSSAAMTTTTQAMSPSDMETSGSSDLGAGDFDVDTVSRPISTTTFVATDYAYDGPYHLTEGANTIVLTNEGTEPHQAQLFKLADGKTMADVESALALEQEPDWMTAYGGPNAVNPGGEGSGTFDLPAGDYVVVCDIPSPDGTPHVAKGMITSLTVEKSAAPAPLPVAEADAEIDLEDFGFTHPPLTAGQHTFEVVNKGDQPHELVLIRLDEGKTPADFAAAFGPDAPPGPPPGAALGGVSGMAPDQTALFTADLTPGNYGLLCFFTDAETGKPHFALGMMDEFTIQ